MESKNNGKLKKEELKQSLSNSEKQNTAKNEEFKRRYFEFYDDIKISDRQDW